MSDQELGKKYSRKLEREIMKRTRLEEAAAAAMAEARNSGLPGLAGGPADAYRHMLVSAEMTRRKEN